MTWVRCPKCRTLNDVDRYAQCDGCQGDLTGLPPASPLSSSPVARQRERDSRSAHWILWALAGTLLLATFLLPAGGAIITAFLAVLLLIGLFIHLSGRWIRRTGLPFALQVLLGLIAVAASFIGAVLLVGLACTGPMSRA